MFPYRVKYTESESDIQNNDLLYNIDQQYQNTFQKIQNFRENHESIFFKSFDFKMISVLWRFVWPAFGGPKILVNIYIYIYKYKNPKITKFTNIPPNTNYELCKLYK